MNNIGLGLGMLLAGLVLYMGFKEASRRSYAAVPAPLPKLPESPGNAMLRLYQRHPEYLRSLRAVQA